MPYKDLEKRREVLRRFREKRKSLKVEIPEIPKSLEAEIPDEIPGEISGEILKSRKSEIPSEIPVNPDLAEDVTDEPEFDPTVLYLTVLSQRVDALAAEVTELKKVGSAIKIDSLMPVLKGMVEEALKEIKDRIIRLEEAVESLEARVSKIEEILQECQFGVSVGLKGGVRSSRHSSRDNGNGELKFSKRKQVEGVPTERYVLGRLIK